MSVLYICKYFYKVHFKNNSLERYYFQKARIIFHSTWKFIGVLVPSHPYTRYYQYLSFLVKSCISKRINLFLIYMLEYLQFFFCELHVYNCFPLSACFSASDYFSLLFLWENGYFRDSVFAQMLNTQLGYCKGQISNASILALSPELSTTLLIAQTLGLDRPELNSRAKTTR